MKVTVENVTPAKAKKWLESNTKNRPMRVKYVDTLAAEILEGRWKENGDAIRFNGTELIDGQHRLAAIVQAGKTVKSIVVRDLAGHVFDTIDVGRGRRASDILALRGETNTHALAATVKMFHAYENGNVLKNKTIPATLIEEVLSEHQNLRIAVNEYKARIARLKLAPASAICTAYYIFSRIDKPMADRMMDALLSGASLRSDPFHVMRERFIKMRMDKATFHPRIYLALAIKAWNAARDGEELTPMNFRWNPKGDNREDFPVAK